MLPSDSWKTAEELVGHWSGADKVWPRIPFDIVERTAAGLRSPPVPCAANRKKYSNGRYAIIIELVFADGECWVAKLWTAHHDPGLAPELVSRRVRCEVATLRVVQQRSSIPVPAVFGYSATADNPIGWPYSFMSAILGHTPADLGLEMMYSDDPVPPEKQPLLDAYAASLARVHLQLRNITLDRIGSFYADDAAPDLDSYVIGPDAETGIPPCATAGEFYAAYAEYLLREALPAGARAQDHEGRVFGVWLMRLVLSAAALASSHSQRAFALAHQDLHSGNTLVNAAGDIVGVFDWENAACVPEELFAGQAIEFARDMTHGGAERLGWFAAYGRALGAAETAPTLSSGRSLADLHASTLVQLLRTVITTAGNDPECYAGLNAHRAYCRYMLGTADCDAVRQSPVYQEWLREISLKH